MITRRKMITIVTWKGGANFGTCLQGYALQEKIKSLGYDVCLLPDVPRCRGLKSWLQWFLSKIGLMQLRIYLAQAHDYQTRKRLRWEKSVYQSVTLWTQFQLRRLIKKTDCFVTGSDQIWNTYHHFMPMQFLSFAEDKKRIAYSSSIGTSRFKPEYETLIKDWLLKFKHIGVREKEAVRIIETLTGRSDVVQVIDPTLLLTPEDWRSFSLNARFEVELPKRYLLCYLVGNNPWYQDQLRDVQKKLGLDVVIVPACENSRFQVDGMLVYPYATAPEFVSLILGAEFVCTDSFHATAFCINFQKPFVEFMRFKDVDIQSQNSRIYDILNHYNLITRIYDSKSEIWFQPIDFNFATTVLASDRKRSLRFLIESIEH